MSALKVCFVHDEVGSFSQVARPEDIHVVHGEVQAGIKAPGSLLIAAGAQVMGDVEARGAVHIARGATVAGMVRAMGDVVIGAHVNVWGAVRAEGRVLVQSGAVISGEIDAAGDAQLTPGARVAQLVVGGDLLVGQPVRAPKVRVRGIVTVEPTAV